MKLLYTTPNPTLQLVEYRHTTKLEYNEIFCIMTNVLFIETHVKTIHARVANREMAGARQKGPVRF